MRLLRPVAEPSDIIAAQEATRELVTKALTKGRDYGEIPNVDKPTLFKPGAERVTLAFGCYARFTIEAQEVDHDREVKWVKRRKDWYTENGKRLFQWVEDSGVSLGLYRYVVRCDIVDRATEAVVGTCLGACSTLESKYIDRPRDCENTALKMAEKRALVGATLTTFGLSEQFTQDVEDTTPEPDETPAPKEKRAAAVGAPAQPDEPSCPKCGGRMWDNRLSKKNPKAPDYKCRNKACDGAVWPRKAKGAAVSEDDGYPEDELPLPDTPDGVPF